jgi:hypothetical protein
MRAGTTRAAHRSTLASAWGWCHGTTGNRLGIGHNKGVGIGIIVGGSLQIALVVVFIVVRAALLALVGLLLLVLLRLSGQRRGYFIRIIKILLVERSNAVGTDFGIIRLHRFTRRQWSETNRESLAIVLRNAEATSLMRGRWP